MNKHLCLIMIIILCIIPPALAIICFNFGYHGMGYTNKGQLIKPMILDETINEYLTGKTWKVFGLNCETKKLDEIKKALGKDGFKVSFYNFNFVPKSLAKLNNLGYKYFIANQRNYIILAYKNKSWQNYIYKDIKKLTKN